MKTSLPGLSRTRALQYTRLGRAGISREWPHAYQHLAHGMADVRSPRELHPAFYGCYDWHSSVHTHWMLARLRQEVEPVEPPALGRFYSEWHSVCPFYMTMREISY